MAVVLLNLTEMSTNNKYSSDVDYSGERGLLANVLVIN
ncbi:MAG: hypothetical protein ACI8QQ_003192 [Psychroserpens sp.]|jgi:hypothetical protein